MKLYTVRHGETAWNKENKVCGVTDVELTQRGREQARALAEQVSGLKVNRIIASPLKRAMETAEIVAGRNGLTVQVDPRLTEQDYGAYEGADRQDPGFLANKRCFAYRYPGGESMMRVAWRTYGLMEEIKVKYPEENVLLVCHGGVCRVINTYFRDMTNEEFFHYSLGNCIIEEYEL